MPPFPKLPLSYRGLRRTKETRCRFWWEASTCLLRITRCGQSERRSRNMLRGTMGPWTDTRLHPSEHLLGMALLRPLLRIIVIFCLFVLYFLPQSVSSVAFFCFFVSRTLSFHQSLALWWWRAERQSSSVGDCPVNIYRCRQRKRGLYTEQLFRFHTVIYCYKTSSFVSVHGWGWDVPKK